MDVDIDLRSDFDPTDYLECVRASIYRDGKLLPHPVGYYFQTIPVDPITGLSAIPFDRAEEFGFLKIDMLHLNLLNSFTSKSEIRRLMHTPPDWDLLERKDVVDKLFQIHNHFDVVREIRPRDVQTLADTIAIIRPAKRRMLREYLKNPEKMRPYLYMEPSDKNLNWFKKSHAVAYAFNIILQLHAINNQ